MTDVAIPTPFTVKRSAFTAGATDSYGNPVESWVTATDVAVHGWAPPSADVEPFEQGRNAVVRDLDLYAPAGTVGGPRDRWTVAGTVFEQVGHVEDFSHGPFGFSGGVRINLKRVEG